MRFLQRAAVVATTLLFSGSVEAASQAYTWKNAKIGGGGGFVPGIVFNPTEKGLTYARTDIGGAYRLNADDTWTPITEFVGNANWNQWGIDALATDPVDTSRVYLAAGMYTISWDPNPGAILRSSDKGNTWQSTTLPFKVGGNMPGRGTGERLVVDPNKNNILFFGTRNQGLWKSTDFGATWAKVNSFTWTGTYFQSTENEYTLATQGLAWVTFDKTSGVAGTATPRIFVGLIDKGINVFKSEDGGATWAAVAGQPQQGFIPHKGVLSPSDKLLYISYANASGPYDGSLGTVNKYNITSGVWTDISPTPLSTTYYGYGGLTVDLQKPGTIMVAALNQWWPDATIFRSNNSGATWSPIWEWNGYPARNKYYSYDISAAPWLQDNTNTDEFKAQIGWMIESLEIDPHDSNHWLYGTGATIYGGRDLLKWDTVHNVTVKSLADGIEETAILGLISPPGGPPLLSAVGDIGGFYHANLDVAPSQAFHTPTYGTTLDIDYAGNKPANIVRAGYNSAAQPQPQVAVSTNFGASWSANWAAQPGTVAPGKIAYSADGDSILMSGSAGPLVSKNQATFSAVSTLPSGAVIASDKRNTTVFYGGSAGSFYVSTNSGVTFAKTVSLGAATSVNDISVHPTVAGDVWASTDVGLFHSLNYGASFTQIGSGVTAGWSFAFGAGATATTYPTIYGFFNVTNVITLYKSEDQGVNWYIISDATHGFGAGSANVVSADITIYGRVYVGTNGRGIFYGNPAGTLPSGTATTSSVSKTSSVASSTTTRSSTVTTLSTTTRTSSVATTTTTVRTSSITTTASTTTTSKSSTASPTTTTRVVTTSSTTTSAVTGGATVAPWGKCGGIGYTGPIICATGYTCVVSNPYYSQCI